MLLDSLYRLVCNPHSIFSVYVAKINAYNIYFNVLFNLKHQTSNVHRYLLLHTSMYRISIIKLTPALFDSHAFCHKHTLEWNYWICEQRTYMLMRKLNSAFSLRWFLSVSMKSLRMNSPEKQIRNQQSKIDCALALAARIFTLSIKPKLVIWTLFTLLFIGNRYTCHVLLVSYSFIAKLFFTLYFHSGGFPQFEYM